MNTRNPFELNCWIFGNDTCWRDVFPVTISKYATVGKLKKAIKKEKRPDFNQISAHNLTLWVLNDPEPVGPDCTLFKSIRLLGNNFKPEDFAMELDPWAKIWSLFRGGPTEKMLHIIVQAPPASRGVYMMTDIANDIIGRWTKKTELVLPSISELIEILDQPLPEAEKIPVTLLTFDSLLSSTTNTNDICTSSNVEKLFRVSDEETAAALHDIFYSAIVRRMPSAIGSEASFHSFWDDNIRNILELFFPSALSVRDSNCGTGTGKLTLDYGLLLDNVCVFRGEEESPDSSDDPKAKLSDKLTWVYDPAPYVFGYYATGAKMMLVAICAPQTPSQRPIVHDLAFVDLEFRSGRITNLCWLVKLSPYITPLVHLSRVVY